ncbi:MAG: hypothetical protein ACKODX_04295 [Gemmata sp.]
MLSCVRSVAAGALCAALVAALALDAPGPALAQDKEAVAKAKEAALANLKKAGVAKPTVVETDNYLIVGSLSEDKAKALGAALEKTTELTRKALKYDAKDFPWKGKLVVYFVPDDAEFKALMRRAFQQPPEGVYADIRVDPPVLVDPVNVPGKPTDADLYASTAARLSGEYLKAKILGRESVPEWLRNGFGRATAIRAEGTSSKRYQAYRSQAKSAVLGAKGGKPPAMSEIWGESKITNGDVLAASFAEYLAYGPGAAKFSMFLDALKPGENNASPTTPQALDAAGWKDKDLMKLESDWRRYVQTGK